MLTETSPELRLTVSAVLAPLFGQPLLRVTTYNTGGGCMVVDVDLTQDGRGMGRTLWLSSEDDWLLGVYDWSAADDDEGVCVGLLIAPQDMDNPQAVARKVADLLTRLGVTLQDGPAPTVAA